MAISRDDSVRPPSPGLMTFIPQGTFVWRTLYRTGLETGDVLGYFEFQDLVNSLDDCWLKYYSHRHDTSPAHIRVFHRGMWVPRWELSLVSGHIWDQTTEFEQGMGSEVWMSIVAKVSLALSLSLSLYLVLYMCVCAYVYEYV